MQMLGAWNVRLGKCARVTYIYEKRLSFFQCNFCPSMIHLRNTIRRHIHTRLLCV